MTQPVRLLINALHAKTGGGVTYLAALLPQLSKRSDLDVHLLLHESQRALFQDLGANVRLHIVAFKDGFLRGLIWEQLALPPLAWAIADVTFSPANFGPLLAPRPVVLLRNALGVARHESRLAKKIYWRALGLMTWLSLLVSPAAIAVSSYAKRHLAFGFSHKVQVVHHGADHQRFHPDDEPRGDFVLAVGDLTVQKNFHTLIEALARLPRLSLRIAGSRVDEGYAARLDALVEKFGLAGRVTFLGAVGKEELAGLYRRCAVFAFPSTVETFGNPLVEAMASGCAIVSSDAAAMPEILDGAGFLVTSQDIDAWAQALQQLIASPALADSLRQKALQRAKSFAWETTADQTASLLISVAERPSAPRFRYAAWLWVVLILAAYLSQFLNIWPALMAALSIA